MLAPRLILHHQNERGDSHVHATTHGRRAPGCPTLHTPPGSLGSRPPSRLDRAILRNGVWGRGRASTSRRFLQGDRDRVGRPRVPSPQSRERYRGLYWHGEQWVGLPRPSGRDLWLSDARAPAHHPIPPRLVRFPPKCDSPNSFLAVIRSTYALQHGGRNGKFLICSLFFLLTGKERELVI